MCILYRHYSRRVTCDCSHTQPPTCMTKCCQTFLFGEGAIPVSFSTVFLRWPAPQKNGDWCAFNSSGTADFLSSKRHLWRRGDGEIAGYWKKFENLVSASSGRSVKWSMKGMFNQFLAHAKELSIRLHDTFFGKYRTVIYSSIRQLPPMCLEARYSDRLCSNTWFLKTRLRNKCLFWEQDIWYQWTNRSQPWFFGWLIWIGGWCHRTWWVIPSGKAT